MKRLLCFALSVVLSLMMMMPLFANAEETNDISVDYHRSTSMIDDMLGAELKADLERLIDAFLAHDTSVTIPKADGEVPGFMTKLGFALNMLFPPFTAHTSWNEYSSYDEATSTIHWTYLVSNEELDAMLCAFSNAVQDYLSLVRADDADVVRALMLYNALTNESVYNYDDDSKTVEEDELDAYDYLFSSYYVLVNHSGTCYPYATALTFLYAQVGLDACSVDGWSSPGDGHTWTIAKLDGDYYYFDPTWDLGGTIRYFGMTAEEREANGQFKAEDVTLYITPVLSLFNVDSTRFSELRALLMPAPLVIDVNREADTVTVSCEETGNACAFPFFVNQGE